ncbi:Short-chain dehydrogenase/reductase SDR [Nitrospina gracilis 3/211]|uniref:Short-chain dehydrogenase/reductase SDR n=1 Tax=Nitrospina gracilis (strain 3/211) TaxID=1266370 RepID=M1YWA5_NITG3|nr:SDR family oxidoreductase [Nitrospina gracilis]MCF8722803.1 NAD(P)-dependent dehydrogenase (short-subunit alcohol dehydrogenase family) [Nitrospina sp. Nb-3]CCQ89758.1 Short-chain dehydrogenase/reductase SDR [Nitrospina gracilis 3/211]
MKHPDPNFSLDGKTVLLTGGAGILGSRFSLALAANGARVAVVDRNAEKADEVTAAVNAVHPDAARAYPADITNKDALVSLNHKIEAEFGLVDVLINNAAFKSPNFFEPFETFPLEDWNQVMEVNTTGVMLGCQVFGSAMAERGSGSIINTLSIYGITAPDQRIYEGSEYEGRAINTPAVYSTSKAAVWGLTQYLAAYWGGKGVRVNAVTPGGVFSGQNDTFVRRYSQKVPMGRMAEPDEMCGAVLFLASDASSYMTGQNLVVDGGWTVW